MMRLAWLGLLVFLCAIATAHADDLSSAREHSLKAKRAFELGLYDEAITEYNLAYKAKDDPAILYNLGQAYRLAGRPQDALRCYKLFLGKIPNPPNRDLVLQWMSELQKQIASKGKVDPAPPPKPEPVVAPPPPKPEPVVAPPSPKPEPVVAPPPPKPEPVVAPPSPKPEPVVASPPPKPEPVLVAERRPAMFYAGIGTLVAGALLVAGGGAAYALADRTGTQLLDREQSGGTYDNGLYRTGEARVLAGNLCVGIGGAAVIAGAVVTALGAKQRGKHALQLVPSVGREHAALQLGGHF